MGNLYDHRRTIGLETQRSIRIQEGMHPDLGSDGNQLFNLGSIFDRRIGQRQINRLKEMGKWLKINGEAVYGTHGGPYLPMD